MGKQKTLEETYQKKELREHILIRPDSYIGSIELQEQNMWILAEDEKSIENKQISYIPGFYKIFDEIIVNAADNFQVSKQNQLVMDTMKVNIDKAMGMISVWNNGKGIPIEIHKEHKIYAPELIFGHLLTGSNYDDNEKKVVGGRNGYGAKLTNIWSTKFQIECEDVENQLYFRIEWTDNMTKKSKEVIEKRKIKENSTCVTFFPDLKRFKIDEISSDMLNLMKKRVYDIAGIYSERIKVYLNNQRIQMKKFKDYVNMYIKNEDESLKIYDKQMTTDRWELLVTFSDGQFKSVSFVNSICTSRGGTHVNYITDQIVKEIQDQINKRHKKLTIKPHMIKQNLFIFVNCLIENPAFDSQTKDTLTTKVSQFGSKPQFTEKFIKQILSTGIIEQIVEQAKARENTALAKQLKGTKKARIIGIDKLDDANDAGTKNSANCTLILTEGDSAKALAMAGVSIIGRDKFGVFPLRGKLLNVREAPVKQLSENKEIQNLIKIIGLQAEKTYEDVKDLRYGSIMIMTDQDHDGSHIKGLIINFIHHFWPSLYKMPGFLKEFVTPIIKATPKRGNQPIESFFSLGDFKEWTRTHNINNYTMKYYKGLGTSNEKEAVQYFKAINQHKIQFQYVDDQDNEAIQLCFNKKNADKRKRWLAEYDQDAYVNHSIKILRYLDFVNLEYINSDNIRSIPSLVDGMKPGQRKILFSCFKRNLVKEVKVAQLSGYVAEQSAYHHGEQSLATTIIGMAQSFVGSNNVSYLTPNGQFGTRNLGGKDHAAARYLYTQLSTVTRKIFKEEDDHVLKYLEDENLIVEPEWYIPIIPMVLVNGTSGIGTGWSTDIPCYNAREIAEEIKKKLEGGSFEDLVPSYKGFQGEIELTETTNKDKNTKIYTMSGIYSVKGDELEITELPVGKWTKDYKTTLEKMLEEGNTVSDFKEYHTQNRVHFWIQFYDGVLEKMEQKGQIETNFKLKTTLQTSNLVLFNKDLKLRRYQNTVEILEEFYSLRLSFYEKRKYYLVSKIKREVEILSNRVKFILAVINDEIQLKNVKRKAICENLLKNGFTPMKKIQQIESTKLKCFKDEAKDDEEEDDQETGNNISPQQFNYLLSMPLWSLTYEKVQELQSETNTKEQELQVLEQTTIKEMWYKDLDEFIDALDEFEEDEEQNRLLGGEEQGEGNGKKKKKQQKKKQQAKKVSEGEKEVKAEKAKGKPKEKDTKDKVIKEKGDKESKNKSKPKKKAKNDMEEEEKPPKKAKKQDQQEPQKSEFDMTLEERARKRLKEKQESQQNTQKETKQVKAKPKDNHAERTDISKTIHQDIDSSDDGDYKLDWDQIKKEYPKRSNKRKILKIVDESYSKEKEDIDSESEFEF